MQFWAFLWLFLGAYAVFGQSIYFPDPRSEGRGNTFSVENGPGSLFVNPSGSANLESPMAIITGTNLAGPNGLFTSALAFAMPTRAGVFGLTAGNYGDHYYRQNKAALNWARKSGIAQLGIQTGIVGTFMQGAKSVYSFILDFSGMVQLSPIVMVAAGISNLTKSKYWEEDPIPITGNFGIDIKPIQTFHLTLEAGKDLSVKKPEYKAGCSYLIKETLEILTGITTQPLRQTFGVGLHLKKLAVQWSAMSLPGLGSKQSILIGYHVSKRSSG